MACHGGMHGLDPSKDIRFQNRRPHRDPLSRQIEESVLIAWGLERGVVFGPGNETESIICLNRKEEAFGPRVRFQSNYN